MQQEEAYGCRLAGPDSTLQRSFPFISLHIQACMFASPFGVDITHRTDRRVYRDGVGELLNASCAIVSTHHYCHLDSATACGMGEHPSL